MLIMRFSFFAVLFLAVSMDSGLNAAESFGIPNVSAGGIENRGLRLTTSIAKPANDDLEGIRILYSLNNPEFRSGIELTDRQYQEFIDFQGSINARFEEICDEFSDVEYSNDIGVKLRQSILNEKGEVDRGVKELIRERQLILSRQFFEREKLRRMGAFEYLMTGEISQKLEIDAEQKAFLRRRWKAILLNLSDELRPTSSVDSGEDQEISVLLQADASFLELNR